MKNRIFYLLGILYFSFSVYSFAELPDTDKEKTVTAEGIGAIANNDIAIAREHAVTDARRKAVEKAIGFYLQSETLVKNYALIEDRIYNQTKGYIIKEKVLQEGKEGELYKVTLEALVGTGAIQDDLSAIGLLMRRKHKPRLMVLMDETIDDKHTGSLDENNLSAAETELNKIFAEKGFNLVSKDILRQKLTAEDLKKITTGDNTAIRSLYSVSSADILIIGQAKAEVTGTILGTQMRSHQAVVTARIMKADTGSIIGTSEARKAKPHISSLTGCSLAIQEASKELAEKLSSQIIDFWDKEFSSGMVVQIVVENMEAAQLGRMKDILSYEIRGVEGVNQRGFIDNKVVFDLDTRSDGIAIGDEFSRKKFAGFNFKIKSITQNKIELVITGEK